MNKPKLSILFLLVAILVINCGKNIQKSLPGKWVIDEDPDVLTMEFLADGKVVSTYGVGASLNGTWQTVTDSTVEISLDPWILTGQMISEDKLILKSEGKEKVYRKIE